MPTIRGISIEIVPEDLDSGQQESKGLVVERFLNRSKGQLRVTESPFGGGIFQVQQYEMVSNERQVWAVLQQGSSS